MVHNLALRQTRTRKAVTFRYMSGAVAVKLNRKNKQTNKKNQKNTVFYPALGPAP